MMKKKCAKYKKIKQFMIYIGYWLVNFWTIQINQIFTNQFWKVTQHFKKISKFVSFF